MSNMKKYTLLSIFLLTFFSALIFAQVQKSNLPTFFITTLNSQPVVDKDNYLMGNIVVKSSDSTENLSLVTQIKGRGNSTWGLAKKPYRIKLNSKTKLLNLPAKAKSWVLLANYGDKTLMRNALALKISSLLGLEFTPSARFVDLVLNGTYLGNYLLTDQMEAGPGRVNIDIQDSTVITEPDITGGYFLELDGFASDPDIWFASGKGLKMTVHSPDVMNKAQLAYIQNYINGFENALFSTNFKDPVKGYRAIVDTTSLINWYIGCELTGNSDSFWSTYIYKKRSDDKLYFGPMWDYDIAFNNDSRLGDATTKLMRESAFDPRTWINQLWLDDWFRTAVWRRWQKLNGDDLLGVLTTFIDQTSTLLNASQQLNFQTWNVLNTKVYLEQNLYTTYSAGVDYLKTYMSSRVNFLNTSFAYTEPPKPSEPFVVTNNYYMILNKRTNNTIDINQNSVASNATLVMWTPIKDDNSQLWQIIQVGDGLYHIINKNSGLAMTGNGSYINLIQTLVNSTNNAQKWSITPVLTGNTYGIVNLKSGYAIDNSGGGFANGTSAIEYSKDITGNVNQQWYFQKVDTVSTGLSQSDYLQQKVEILPNPATDNIKIKFTNNEPQPSIITILSIPGIVKYQAQINNLNSGNEGIDISLSGFESGVYLVYIMNHEGEKVVRKLIVAHP
jgi:hypothetical protein